MQTDAPRDNNGQPKHETTDVSARPILWFGAALVVGVAVVQLLVWWLLIEFDEKREKAQPPVSPLSKERLQLPENISKIPAPRLQKSEYHDVREMHKQHEQILNSYGWADRDHGTIHIPIERAMNLMANPEMAGNHGIPIRREQPQ